MTSNITKKVIEDLIESDKKGLEEYGVTITEVFSNQTSSKGFLDN